MSAMIKYFWVHLKNGRILTSCKKLQRQNKAYIGLDKGSSCGKPG